MPVTFVEFGRVLNEKKLAQSFCNANGCVQYMKKPLNAYPLLGFTVSPDTMQCVAYCPDNVSKIGCVEIAKEPVTEDSIRRMLRTMMYWALAVQRFMSSSSTLQFRPHRNRHNVVFSGMSVLGCWCALKVNPCVAVFIIEFAVLFLI